MHAFVPSAVVWPRLPLSTSPKRMAFIRPLYNDSTMMTRPLMRLPCLISQPLPLPPAIELAPWKRFARYQAFDASFDADELAEARKWRQAFSEDALPKGTTTFARSSGPGGQHVNKSVSTQWPLDHRQSVHDPSTDMPNTSQD